MSIVDMICRMNEIVTEIRKCESMYYYCDDAEQIYNHLLKSIYALNKPSMLFQLAQEDLNEKSSLDLLKLKLLILYGIWRDEFVQVLSDYHQVVEQVVAS